MRKVTGICLVLTAFLFIAGVASQTGHPSGNNPVAESQLRGLSNPQVSSWTELQPQAHPSARWGSGLVYDPADGFVLLFGGSRASYGPNNSAWQSKCLNDTWTFKAGNWTQLAVATPPVACHPAMAFDVADQYVVAYLSVSNQTWTFSHGKWSRLAIPEPDSAILPDPGGTAYWFDVGATAVYDAAVGAILLYETHYTNGTSQLAVEETWEFSGGSWTRVNLSPAPLYANVPSGHLAYDPLDGKAVLVCEDDSGSTTPPSAVNMTWTFRQGNWSQATLIPENMVRAIYDGGPLPIATAYDSRDGYVLAYSSPLEPGGLTQSIYGNFTWTYRDGIWTNESIPGPPGRWYPSMTFDAADGYVVLFGGSGYGTLASQSFLKGDTWIYSGPPVALRLSIAIAPERICSLTSEDCGAGTDEARVNLSVDVVPAGSAITGWIDSGNGTVEYGPDYWFEFPQIIFVPRWDLTPAPNLDPQVSCSRGDGEPTACNVAPTTGSGNSTQSLGWNWSGAASVPDALWLGDTWNVSFVVRAVGPPYASVPVDTCVTSLCFAKGAGVLFGPYTELSFGVSSGSARMADSFPLALVSVLPPETQTPPPPGAGPPPPPPSNGAPLPVSTPTPATPVPLPILVPIVGSLAVGTVSLPAVAAGLIGAGAARASMTRHPQRLGVAARVTGRPETPRAVRGED